MKANSKLLQNMGALLRKYRYPALILLLGVFLLLLPSNAGTEKEDVPAAEVEDVPEARSMEAQLEALLSRVDGAGRVAVMLTIAESEETVYQSDLEEAADSRYQRTVLAESGSSAETPIPSKTIGAVYQGAVVVAEGGDRASVRLDLIRAVSSLTGLGADRITVVKMKTD